MADDFFNDVIHIYGQAWWHCDAEIVGTAEALTKLRDQLNELLNQEITEKVENYYANDGEGYELRIKKVASDDMKKLSEPYSDAPGINGR